MNAKPTKKPQKRSYRWYFLAGVLVFYLGLLPFAPAGVRKSLWTSGGILLRIIPIFVLVLVFMTAIHYFLTPKSVSKYVGKGSGLKGWLLAILTGILSHGPIYAWYPALQELRQHGMRSGLAAAFLYNRAIKIPLLPVIVYYFGVKYVGILLGCMILASVLEGMIIEMLER